MNYDQIFYKAETIFEDEYNIEGSGYIHKESFRWGFERGYQEAYNEHTEIVKLIKEFHDLNNIKIPLDNGTQQDIDNLENAWKRQDEIMDILQIYINNYYHEKRD